MTILLVVLHYSVVHKRNMEKVKTLCAFLTIVSILSTDGLPTLAHIVCEYYNLEKCMEDPSHCNSTTECIQTDVGKRLHCYAFLTNTSGVMLLSKKGCWLDDVECYNRSKCIASDAGAASNFYCCCEGNMCNANVTISALKPPRLPSSVPRAVSVITQNDPTMLKTLLFSLLPLVCIAIIVILAFLLWRCRQTDYFDQFETIGDKPLLPTMPPSPLPQAACLRKIALLEVKARGRFGLVHKAQMGDKIVAVKVFPMHDQRSWAVERDFYRTPYINNHDNILKFIAAEKRETDLWLITEFHSRGSLYDHLKGNTVSWSEAHRIIRSMVCGLVFLHEDLPTKDLLPGKPVIAHRDLKSRNILLKDDMTACLADFGLALVLDVNLESLPGQVGTRRYMAPEVLDGSVNFSPLFMLKVDIYAFALVLWEIVSRCTAAGSGLLKEYMMPFQEEVGEHPTVEDMQLAVVHNKTRPYLDPIWCQNEELAELCRTIDDCWDQDPEARLTAECIYERLNQRRHSNYLLLLDDDDDNDVSSLPLHLQCKERSSVSSSFSVDDLSSSVA